MSIAQNPMTGQMKKSMANFNTYVHRGQNVVSSKAFNRKDANTEAQQLQRTSFKLIADVYQSLGGFAESGFPVRLEKQSPYNVFVQQNLPNALDFSGEVPVVDYSKLQIAKGTLACVEVTSATLNAESITLNCLSNIDYLKASADDMLTVLVKKKNGGLKVVRQVRGVEENCIILVGMPGISVDNIEFAYVFVISADGKKASNSVFVEIVAA